MIKIKFSIIVPAYNAEKYLERCLVSLLKQDLPLDEYEIIVINDGSTDRTEIILKDFANRFSNLNYITVANAGVSEARNYGCREAKGEYFLFVDADDWIQSNVLNQIYISVEKDELDILVMDYRYFGEGRELRKEFDYAPENGDSVSEILCGGDFMQECLPRAVWAVAYKNCFWKKHNFSFLPIRHEDEELIPRVFYYAERVKFLPLKFYFYYKNPDSFMMNYNGDSCLYIIQAMESLNHFRQECVKDEDLNRFFKDLIARRLLAIFRRSIRYGAPIEVQMEMIKKMKAKKIAPLPYKKSIIYVLMYRFFPHLFLLYYRLKTKKNRI